MIPSSPRPTIVRPDHPSDPTGVARREFARTAALTGAAFGIAAGRAWPLETAADRRLSVCVATYVPWLLHEPEEGRFVFGGEILDFEGFCETAHEMGLRDAPLPQLGRAAAMLRALVRRLGLEPRVECSSPNVWRSLRSHEGRSLLFLLNLLSAPMRAPVRCRPRARGVWTDLGTHALPPMTVKLVEVA